MNHLIYMQQMTRERLIKRARQLRANIDQIFIDADEWNRRNAHEAGPIDPDPDGQLRRIADDIDRMIAFEVELAKRSN